MAQNPSQIEYFLGVDTGATKTHALLANSSGQVLALAAGGPGNPHGMGGFRNLAEMLSVLVGRVCSDAGIQLADIRSAGLGLAGLDWPSQKEDFLRVLKRIGLPDNLGLVNDAALGIYAGTSQGWGICLSAGTSFNCRGRAADGREGRAIGDGLYWGEGAGAEELVIRAARAVIDEWTMRGPKTRITDLFLDHFHALNRDDLVERLVRRRFCLTADLAPDIVQLAKADDPAARICVQWASAKLAKLAEGAINQLDLKHLPFELVLSGSFFNAGDILIKPLTCAIHAIAPYAEVKNLDVPPVCGGILLAMEVAGKDLTNREKIRNKLRTFSPDHLPL